MATQDVNAPTIGAQGEPCADCGAVLAGDQRYCLSCGTRSGTARIAFRDILARPGGSPAQAIAEPGSTAALTGRPSTTLAFLVGLACLLLALGVGVLIGRSGGEQKAAAPAPAQVITVNGGAASPSTTASDGASTGSGTTSKAKSGSSSTSKATNQDLKQNDSLSGAAYQKKSTNLPKQVGTGGKAPPKDNKPAGGGTGFQDIG